MWKSIKYFTKAIISKAWIGILFIFLDLADVYNLIKPLLPAKWGNMTMPAGWGFVIFALIILWSAFIAYHDLRTKKMEEFLEYAPEFKQDRVFRIFYELHKEGEFLKNANTARRQRWDEEVLKNITMYCNPAFRMNYLINTRRNIDKVTPLQDENYDSAIYEVKDFLNNMFKYYIKQ